MFSIMQSIPDISITMRSLGSAKKPLVLRFHRFGVHDRIILPAFRPQLRGKQTFHRPRNKGAFDPNVWTGCVSQLIVHGSRKPLLCIRPVDRHAGRGLDGSTHASLISLADRSEVNHLGHQILDASINPFHAFLDRELV
jgi:hypothetical protein